MSSLHDHGRHKFPNAGLIASSTGRNWNGVAMELRAHPDGELPPILPQQTEITMTLSGDATSVVRRNGNGRRQETPVAPNTLWLCPSGVYEDKISISRPIDRVAHIYVSDTLFAEVARESRGGWAAGNTVDYIAGLQDDLVVAMVQAMICELENETTAGRVLVDALSLSLAARLICTYGTSDIHLARAPRGLDARRLRRVLEFISDEIEGELSIDKLAKVACLSRHHFARAFKVSMGVAPSRYISELRYKHAINLLTTTNRGLGEIAAACQFSSQANFTRAFTRASGMTPGQLRRQRLGH